MLKIHNNIQHHFLCLLKIMKHIFSETDVEEVYFTYEFMNSIDAKNI